VTSSPPTLHWATVRTSLSALNLQSSHSSPPGLSVTADARRLMVIDFGLTRRYKDDNGKVLEQVRPCACNVDQHLCLLGADFIAAEELVSGIKQVRLRLRPSGRGSGAS